MDELPRFLYGTAWKKDLTKKCVLDALEVGYRGIDTANQLKHYNEKGVGDALEQAYKSLGVSREDVFLQTKYTFRHGQGEVLPYNENDSIEYQVRQSFENSLEHLKTDYIDSYLLHGPMTRAGLRDEDWEAWSAIESLHESKRVGSVGVSNMNYPQLEALIAKAKVKPQFVQNRCFATTLWDEEVRELCKRENIIYQGFSLLTANMAYLGGRRETPADRDIPQATFSSMNLSSELMSLVKKYEKTIQQIIFRFCLQLEMLPLTGTRNTDHMKMNLDVFDFSLSDEEIEMIKKVAF